MKLADHPDEVVTTTNDDEAQAFLAELGILEKLQPHFANPGQLTGHTLRVDHWRHSTHWITSLRYVGFQRPEDNGFAVRCLPKSKISREMFETQVQTELKQEFPDGHTRIDWD